ncbi:MAG: hypothetical protein WAV45_07365 [Propionibacteriaceae bacterium]
MQINGVVWTQVMVGNMVYAGGEFTAARPAGADVGMAEVPRRNLLAYDIVSGELNSKFVPGALNGKVKALAVSSDKKTLYVGGSFTKVGETTRARFAALNISTGALKSARPSFNSTVNALAVNSGTIFAGGMFSSVNGKTRSRLAAISVSSGKLRGWKARADNVVNALLLTEKSKLLVVGGMFKTLNSTAASGSGAVSPSTGKTRTWKANKVVKNGGSGSAILNFSTDGSTVYGAGFTSGTGNFEGVYAASSANGKLRWLQDCHGDTYDVLPLGDVVYSVGHAHYCSNIGGFPDTSDYTKSRSTWYRALAVTKSAVGTVAKNGQNSAKTYSDFRGNPAPALLNWFPDLTPGSYTGMAQSAWSVVGNGKYISLGGEFTKVGGVPQQGLVRMATPTVAPNKVGPVGLGDSIALAAEVQANDAVTLNWAQLWDRDDLSLRYELSRDGVVIDARTVAVPFWQRTAMSFVDANRDPNTLTRYRVAVSDPMGNTVRSATVTVRPSPSETPPPTSGDTPTDPITPPVTPTPSMTKSP